MAKALTYISLDVEAAGANPLRDPTLSVGACVVARPFTPFMPFAERVRNDLVFYAELKPNYLFEFDEAAMRVGCLHLVCLEELRKTDSRYDPTHKDFDCLAVLRHMQNVCEHPRDALVRFDSWLNRVASNKKTEAVYDTVNHDPVRINNWLAIYYARETPFGHKGLDLASMHRGMAMYEALHEEGYPMGPAAKLGHFMKQFKNVIDWRDKEHRADQDATWTADIAHHILSFEKMGW